MDLCSATSAASINIAAVPSPSTGGLTGSRNLGELTASVSRKMPQRAVHRQAAGCAEKAPADGHQEKENPGRLRHRDLDDQGPEVDALRGEGQTGRGVARCFSPGRISCIAAFSTIS